MTGYPSRAEVLRFAEGFRGPCIITQNCDRYSVERADPRCCHVEITAQIDQSTGDVVEGTRCVKLLEGEDLRDPIFRANRDFPVGLSSWLFWNDGVERVAI